MFCYRISKKPFINDLTGTGARMYGGRWNNKGTPMLYLSESPTGAVLEYLVHVSRNTLPNNIYIAKIEIPDDATTETIDIANLPKDWHSTKAPTKLADIGTNWVLSMKSLILRVPSVPCFLCYNSLINPLHKEIHDVKVVETLKYPFDKRLFKQPKSRTK